MTCHNVEHKMIDTQIYLFSTQNTIIYNVKYKHK